MENRLILSMRVQPAVVMLPGQLLSCACLTAQAAPTGPCRAEWCRLAAGICHYIYNRVAGVWKQMLPATRLKVENKRLKC